MNRSASNAEPGQRPWTGLDRVENEQGEFQGIRIQVSKWGGEEKVLFVRNVDPTARQVCDEMIRREKLNAASSSLFSLWIVGHGLELQLKPKHDLFRVVEKFPRYLEKYTHQLPEVLQWKLYFKREALLSLEVENKCRDYVAVKLLYDEAVHNVMTGRYPCSVTDAVILAGMQMQLYYGDHNPSVHTADFFTADMFAKLMPQQFLNEPDTLFPRLMASQSRRLELMTEWTVSICNEHKKLVGKDKFLVNMLYLKYVRQWDFYGSTFFTACFNPPARGYFEEREENILIGINTRFITIIDAGKYKLMYKTPFNEMNYDLLQDMVLLEFGSGQHFNSLYLITPQAKLVRNVIVKAILKTANTRP